MPQEPPGSEQIPAVLSVLSVAMLLCGVSMVVYPEFTLGEFLTRGFMSMGDPQDLWERLERRQAIYYRLWLAYAAGVVAVVTTFAVLAVVRRVPSSYLHIAGHLLLWLANFVQLARVFFVSFDYD